MRYFPGTIPYFSSYLFLAVVVLIFPRISSANQSDCHIIQSKPVIDYGRLTPSQTLNERMVTVTVNCVQPKRVGLFFDGDGQHGQDFIFGERGAIKVSVSSGVVDGRKTSLSRWNKAMHSEDRLMVLAGDGIVWKDSAFAASGRLFSVVIGVEPTVPTQALRLRDITSLEGRISLRLKTD